MPNAPGGSATGSTFCWPSGPTLMIFPAAGTTTSPVLVAAADDGAAPAANAERTLTCTPGAARTAPCDDAAKTSTNDALAIPRTPARSLTRSAFVRGRPPAPDPGPGRVHRLTEVR